MCTQRAYRLNLRARSHINMKYRDQVREHPDDPGEFMRIERFRLVTTTGYHGTAGRILSGVWIWPMKPISLTCTGFLSYDPIASWSNSSRPAGAACWCCTRIGGAITTTT